MVDHCASGNEQFSRSDAEVLRFVPEDKVCPRNTMMLHRSAMFEKCVQGTLIAYSSFITNWYRQYFQKMLSDPEAELEVSTLRMWRFLKLQDDCLRPMLSSPTLSTLVPTGFCSLVSFTGSVHLSSRCKALRAIHDVLNKQT